MRLLALFGFCIVFPKIFLALTPTRCHGRERASVIRPAEQSRSPESRSYGHTKRSTNTRNQCQWLKWFCEAGGGAHLTKPGWSKLHTHSNPTNLALFRHKITLYRFNRGGLMLLQGVQMGAGGLSPLAPHFNHWVLEIMAISSKISFWNRTGTVDPIKSSPAHR